MRFLAILSCIVILNCTAVPASEEIRSLQKKISQLRQQDNIEEFIYAYLDAFLKKPGPDQLKLLMAAEDSLWRPLQNPEEKLAFVILKSNEGYYQAQFGQIAKAIQAYEVAWRMFDTHDLDGFDIVEYCLKPLGNAYSMLGDFESAEKIVKSYLLKARKNAHHEHLSSAVINLSIIYYSTGKFKQAIRILEQGLEAPELPENKRGLFYANLAKSALALGNYESALEMSKSALGHFRKYPPWDASVQIVNTYSTLSAIYQKVDKPDQALQNIQLAIGIADTSSTLTRRAKAKIHIQKAGILSEMGQNIASLEIYKSILKELIHGYEDRSGLPEKNALYAENTLKEALDGMAGVYSKIDSLQLALNCFDLSFEVENQLRSGYYYHEAKYLQQQENRERAESAILLLIRMHAEDSREEHIKKAFEIAENTKSLVHKSAYHERQFWSYIHNDSLTQIRKQLNLQKAQLQNAVIQEQLKGNNADIKYIEQLIDQQSQVMLALKEHQLEAASGSQEILLPEGILTDSLQEVLQDRHETMIQYFMGNHYLFIFLLDGQTIQLFTSANVQALKDEVRQLLLYFGDPNKINNSPKNFARIAYLLHNQLMPGEVDSSLVIVADGILNFIPFEALLYALPDDVQYARWPWVLKRHLIANRTSATEILQAVHSGRAGPNKVLGMFPEFNNSPRHLKYSKNESDEMQRYLDGKYLFKENATKQAFLTNISHFPILHLSTHADAGDLYTPPSIAFIDSALFLPEIYGLDIDNKLMVLSACETGIGKLHTGESAISLANGFVQAGVNNIVFSLWQVNDYSTSRLMANFYQHYANSEAAHLALRNAKLDYLNSEDISLTDKSPYFWASFVYYGTTQVESADTHSKTFSMSTVVVSICFISLLLLYIKLWRKNREGNAPQPKGQ